MGRESTTMGGTGGMVACRGVAILRLVDRRISIGWGWGVAILGSWAIVGGWTVTISWVHGMVG